jgi:hypothetical protein
VNPQRQEVVVFSEAERAGRQIDQRTIVFEMRRNVIYGTASTKNWMRDFIYASSGKWMLELKRCRAAKYCSE